MRNVSVKIVGIVPRIKSIKGTYLTMQTCASVPERMAELKKKRNLYRKM